MKNKKIFIIFILWILFASMLYVSVSAETWPAFNVCCEKTKAGAWCQNAEEKDCDSSFQKTPTSCESTSFCKPGCCIDTQEGICMENTPQKVCENSGGTWADDEQCNVPQCNLGCCLLGEQASFVTLTRCKKLSSFYGLMTNFRKDIKDENTCILITQLQDKGACVYESEYKRTCRFATREECSNIKTTGNVTSQSVFYKDYLCSADELAADCGPTKETICIEGKQEVYFKDSCGNPANIYDGNKINDKDYWKKIVPKSESCGSDNGNGNANSRTCGNCDYFKGSICKKGNANYGEYICTGLSCRVTINGQEITKKNGESWCEYQTNYDEVKKLQGKDLVGSRHFRHICINGEEMIEYCDDFRAKFCYEENVKVSGVQFTEAACIANRWRDCMNQDNQEDCENTDKRDCYWKPGYYFTGAGTISATTYSSTVPSKGTGGFSGGTPVTFSASTSSGFSGGKTTASTTGSVITGFATADSEQSAPTIKKSTKSEQGACLPAVTPGLRFWDSTEAASICNMGSTTCVVTCEESLIKGFSLLKSGCEDSQGCLDKNGELNGNWAESMNNLCTGLGDCGANFNVAGEYTSKGAEFKISGEKQNIEKGTTIGQGIYNQIKQKAGL